MLEPQKISYTWNFQVNDPGEGLVNYTMCHVGKTPIEAMKKLRANLATIIQQINETVEANKQQTDDKNKGI